jgi:hypothetical protein|tara:strand:- start:2790 stop:2978 length:189 start_codon:yes stop_codon:yes gene_type:complete
MNYRPYSIEWHRYRYLKEAIDKYLDDYVSNDVIVADIHQVLNERSSHAREEFTRIDKLSKDL